MRLPEESTLRPLTSIGVDPEALDIHRRVNLARWTGRLGLGAGIITAKTLRRRLFGLPGRLTRSARRLTLHLPVDWPWAAEFSAALARFRALPLLA
jgi:hypothetical protein